MLEYETQIKALKIIFPILIPLFVAPDTVSTLNEKRNKKAIIIYCNEYEEIYKTKSAIFDIAKWWQLLNITSNLMNRKFLPNKK